MMNRIVVMAIAALGGAMLASAQDGSTLSGTVTSEAAAAVADVWVTANRDYAEGVESVNQAAPTDDKGNFAFKSLPEGTYTVCVQAAAQGLLDPCHWMGTPPRVKIAAGEAQNDLAIVLKAGEIFQVRIDDPDKRLRQDEGKKDGAWITMVVTTPEGLAYSLSQTADDDSGRTYQLTIPPDTDLNFQVASNYFDLDDGTPGGLGGQKNAGLFKARFRQAKKGGVKKVTLKLKGVRGQ